MEPICTLFSLLDTLLGLTKIKDVALGRIPTCCQGHLDCYYGDSSDCSTSSGLARGDLYSGPRF